MGWPFSNPSCTCGTPAYWWVLPICFLPLGYDHHRSNSLILLPYYISH